MTASVQTGASTVRARIVEAALALIGERGVAGVTNRRVAAAAGVSLGTVTYHFPSQRSLLRECLHAFVDGEVRRIESLAAGLGHPGLDAAEAAQATERAVEGMVLEPRHLGVLELYLQAARDPELRDSARRCWEGYDRAAARLLGRLGADPGRAGQVVSLVAGAQLRRVATGDPAAGSLAAGLTRLVAPSRPHRGMAEV